jgi:hypothetical protein
LFMLQKKNDFRDLQQGIQDGFVNIRRTRGIFERLRQSLSTPATSHFKHFLQSSVDLKSETMLHKFYIHRIFCSCTAV